MHGMFKHTRQIARNYHHFACKNVFIKSVAIYSKLFPPVLPTIFYVVMKQLKCCTVIVYLVGQIIPYISPIDQMVIQAPNFACRLTLVHYL